MEIVLELAPPLCIPMLKIRVYGLLLVKMVFICRQSVKSQQEVIIKCKKNKISHFSILPSGRIELGILLNN
jgi:hypothetical protein